MSEEQRGTTEERKDDLKKKGHNIKVQEKHGGGIHMKKGSKGSMWDGGNKCHVIWGGELDVDVKLFKVLPTAFKLKWMWIWKQKPSEAT